MRGGGANARIVHVLRQAPGYAEASPGKQGERVLVRIIKLMYTLTLPLLLDPETSSGQAEGIKGIAAGSRSYGLLKVRSPLKTFGICFNGSVKGDTPILPCFVLCNI
jgi:hypothetical protein